MYGVSKMVIFRSRSEDTVRVAMMAGTEQPKHDCPLELLRTQQKYMGLYLAQLELRAVIEDVELET